MTDSGRGQIVFTAATAPARLVGRWHQDLRNAIGADAETFGGSGAKRFFALLVVLAVAYPVAASIVHAVGAPRQGGDTLKLALSPFFDVVYSESLPFMIAAVGIGTFCPALGALLAAVFIPADLLAAGASQVELRTYQWQKWSPFAPHLARAISYGLLWILAVEIPLRARIWADSWARFRGEPSALRAAVGRICATAVLVFFWARALPWLIQPVFVWTAQQNLTPWASSATWTHWPILVVAATAVAGVASFWPRSATLADPNATVTDPTPQPVAPAVLLRRVLARQTVAVILLATLLAGLMTTRREALVLIAGLLVAGPILTLVLPFVRLPSMIAVVPFGARVVVAMAIALGVSWGILSLAGDAVFENYRVVVLALAVVAPLFRFIVEAGVRSPRGESPSAAAPESPASTAVSIILLVIGVSLIFPSAAWAHNCPAPDELGVCMKKSLQANLAMIGAALMAAFAAWFASQPGFFQREMLSQYRFAKDVYRRNKERRSMDDVMDSVRQGVKSGQRNPNIPRRDRKLPW